MPALPDPTTFVPACPQTALAPACPPAAGPECLRPRCAAYSRKAFPPGRVRRWLLAAVAGLLSAALHLPAAALEDVPYVKTPGGVVDAILDLAGVRAGDFLIDLGSGDGRIVIGAARRFGVRGLGVEIDPSLVTLSNERAAQAGVAHLTRFATQDLFDTDLKDASVVTLYLLPDVNLALRPRLLETLAPGTRVVSHDWDMGDWRPDRSIEVDAPDKPVGLHKRSRIHLWIVPARVQGRWQGAITGPGIARELRLSLAQRFQDLAFEADSAAGRAGAHAGSVDGTRVRLTLQVDGRPVLLEGTFGGDAISGEASVDGRSARWRITRQGQDAR